MSYRGNEGAKKMTSYLFFNENISDGVVFQSILVTKIK